MSRHQSFQVLEAQLRDEYSYNLRENMSPRYIGSLALR